MAAVVRQPFGELGPAQLQRLSATKNVQNAITDSLSLAKPQKSLFTPHKRPLSVDVGPDDDLALDTENIDPSHGSFKRSKGLDGTAIKKPTLPAFDFAFTPSTSPDASVTFSSLTPDPHFARNTTPPPTAAAPSSAPAGRSPKHKRVGILSRKRVPASPFTRVDPPSRVGTKRKAFSAQPFSLDAALSGTLSSYKPEALPPRAVSLQKPMPTGWFFAIHEDTPDEEAANLMEHSTCVLDISSDDEAGPSKNQNDRGKENIPPTGHTDESALLEDGRKSHRSVQPDAMVDEGLSRAPLGDLETKDFYGTGLDETSVELVPEEGDAKGGSERSTDVVEAEAESSVPLIKIFEDSTSGAVPTASASEGRDAVVG